MTNDNYIFDVQANEIINLKKLKNVWVDIDEGDDEDYNEFKLKFKHFGEKNTIVLKYSSKKHLYSALEYYTNILNCKTIDVNVKMSQSMIHLIPSSITL